MGYKVAPGFSLAICIQLTSAIYIQCEIDWTIFLWCAVTSWLWSQFAKSLLDAVKRSLPAAIDSSYSPDRPFQPPTIHKGYAVSWQPTPLLAHLRKRQGVASMLFRQSGLDSIPWCVRSAGPKYPICRNLTCCLYVRRTRIKTQPLRCHRATTLYRLSLSANLCYIFLLMPQEVITSDEALHSVNGRALRVSVCCQLCRPNHCPGQFRRLGCHV